MIRVLLATANSFTPLLSLQSLLTDLVMVDEARETKGDYVNLAKNNQLTKTSNAAITEAASQVALATRFLLFQERKTQEALRRGNMNTTRPHIVQVFLPTIVTTANIFTCHFQDADVDLATGEIPFDKVILTPQPYVLFDYPVPYALQSSPEEMGRSITRDELELQARLPILVVRSSSFPDVLKKLHSIKMLPGQTIEWYVNAK